MKRRTFLQATAAGISGVNYAMLAAAQRTAPGFTVGAAMRDITPPSGVSLSGPISRGGKSRGVNDPLHVRATVVESGGARIAIAIVDACFSESPCFPPPSG